MPDKMEGLPKPVVGRGYGAAAARARAMRPRTPEVRDRIAEYAERGWIIHPVRISPPRGGADISAGEVADPR